MIARKERARFRPVQIGLQLARDALDLGHLLGPFLAGQFEPLFQIPDLLLQGFPGLDGLLVVIQLGDENAGLAGTIPNTLRGKPSLELFGLDAMLVQVKGSRASGSSGRATVPGWLCTELTSHTP